MQNTPKRRFSAVLFILLIALLIAGWINRYSIYDWWRLRDYSPPSEIAQLATDTTMTEYGKRLFYVNQPVLSDGPEFQENCTINEVTIVLGCYISTQGIYLFKVDDARLEGVHQVTAAHEMLHAAYQRLSSSEKRSVDAMTKSAFASLDDERIKTTVAGYEARDPSVVPNELHSILATEVAELPNELEDYYSKYFADRQVVVEYSQAYESAFEERRNKVEAYDAQLDSLRQQIDAGNAELSARSGQLESDRAELDALLAAGRVSEYNARVPVFNASVRAYNTTVNNVRSLIDKFNGLVAVRNAVALEENELLQAIDSRPDTLPAH